MKAYEVREPEEGSCVIVFATSGVAARREGSNELNIEFHEVESCTRAPWADQYAPGPVPFSATLEAGWWFDCQHCGVRFDVDSRHGDYDEDLDDERTPVEDATGHYCCQTCQMRQWAERREKSNRKHAAIEAAQVRWPEATNISAGEYGKTWPSREYEWCAQFSLPGLRYAVTWPLGSDHVTVSQCDRDEFRQRYGVKA